MKHLLDTDAFSDIVRGNVQVELQFSRTPPSMVGISSVTVKEIESNTREFSRVLGLQLENWRELSTEVRENTAVYRVNVKSPPRVPDGRW